MTGHRHPRTRPAERRLVLAQPELERLGRHGGHVLDQLAPRRPVGDQLGAHELRHPDGDGEHQHIEVLAGAEDPDGGVGARRGVRFERRRIGAGRHGELVEQRGRREARQALDLDEGLVALDAGRQARLHAERHGGDRPPVGGHVQPIDAVEEAELDAAPAQGLVQRSEDDVAHPGRHLPEDRALVVEERLARQEDPPAGAERGHRRVAVPVGEDEVVEPADERRVGGFGRGAVAEDPRPVVLVVDRPETSRDR